MTHAADHERPAPPSMPPRIGHTSGLPCPRCKSGRTAVLDSRPGINNTIRRRRGCLDCDWRFTTFEVFADLAGLNTTLLEQTHMLEHNLKRLLKNVASIRAQLLAAGADADEATTPEAAE